jgi:hypothetical protein
MWFIGLQRANGKSPEPVNKRIAVEPIFSAGPFLFEDTRLDLTNNLDHFGFRTSLVGALLRRLGFDFFFAF